MSTRFTLLSFYHSSRESAKRKLGQCSSQESVPNFDLALSWLRAELSWSMMIYTTPHAYPLMAWTIPFLPWPSSIFTYFRQTSTGTIITRTAKKILFDYPFAKPPTQQHIFITIHTLNIQKEISQGFILQKKKHLFEYNLGSRLIRVGSIPDSPGTIPPTLVIVLNQVSLLYVH